MPIVTHRTQRTAGRRPRGFTLIELVVTLTLVSVLALVAVPMYEMTVTRAKESELHTALRQIRNALDAYKAATDVGYVAKAPGSSGYPPDLMTLVVGVDTVLTTAGGQPLVGTNNGPAAGAPGVGNPFGPGAAGSVGTVGSNAPANNNAPGNDLPPAHMVFLRSVPRDPFFADQSVPPDQQWNIRAYGSAPGDYSGGAEVFDVSSKSTAIGHNGVAYKDW